MREQLLRRLARRCETHDKAAPSKIRALETELGMTPSPTEGDLVDQLANPDLIDCGKPWCRAQRT